jgi:hypothetical protein
MKTLPAAVTILIALASPAAALAQQAKLWSDASKTVQIVDARKANAALMRQYSWTSRTELIEDGKVKDIRIELLNYGPGGQLQRSLLNDQGAPLPFGFLRRAIAEQERKKLEAYMSGLRSLLEQYTLPTPGKVLDFMTQAQMSGPDATGAIQMTGNSVAVPGDTFTVWTDAKTNQTRRMQIATTYQGDAVNVTATFKTLPSKLNYVAWAEATVPAKQMNVQVSNFDYNRN